MVTKNIQTQLEVVKELNGPSVFIGSNIITKLDLETNGLPFRTADITYVTESDIDKVTPTIEQTIDSTEGITESMLDNAMAAIANELKDK